MPATGNIAENMDSSRIRVSVAAVLLFQVAALFTRSFVNLRLLETGIASDSASYLSAMAGFAVLGLLIWPVLFPHWPALRAEFRRPASWGKMLLACVSLGLLCWFLQALALLGLARPGEDNLDLTTYAPMPAIFLQCRNLTGLALAVLVIAFLTPVIEELINKGLILSALLHRGEAFAIISSATLFAVLHVPGNMLFAFLFGVVTAIQFRRYRTLWSAVITHGAYNFLVVLGRSCVDVFWLSGRPGPNTGSTGRLIALCLSCFCAFGIWWLVARYKAGAD